MAGTLVSGDSEGAVQFWDGAMGTHQRRLETHTADVLCITASANELQVFASGVDHKVVCLERLSTASQAAASGGSFGASGGNGNGASSSDQSSLIRWTMKHQYRAHQLDVRGLGTCFMRKERGGVRELLVSGSLDTKLCTYHVKSFSQHRPKRIWPFPHHPVVSFAAQPRFLLVQHRYLLKLWQLPALPHTPPEVELQSCPDGEVVSGTVGGQQLVLEIGLGQRASSIVCSAVSSTGFLIAVSDRDELRLFHLTPEYDLADTSSTGAPGASAGASVDSKVQSVKVRRIRLSPEARVGCQRLTFVRGRGLGRLAAATREGRVAILNLAGLQDLDETGLAEVTIGLEHSFAFSPQSHSGLGLGGGTAMEIDDDDDDDMGAEGGEDPHRCLPFSSLAASADGQWLAAGGAENRIVVFSLDAMTPYWSVPAHAPRLHTPFHPSIPPLLHSSTARPSPNPPNPLNAVCFSIFWFMPVTLAGTVVGP